MASFAVSGSIRTAVFLLSKRNYFLLISIFLILYFGFNLVSGERGLFSYIEKKELLSNLKKEEISLTSKITDMEHKNSLLSTNLDLDYVETLIRKRFLFGKEGETIYIIKNDENLEDTLIEIYSNSGPRNFVFFSPGFRDRDPPALLLVLRFYYTKKSRVKCAHKL